MEDFAGCEDSRQVCMSSGSEGSNWEPPWQQQQNPPLQMHVNPGGCWQSFFTLFSTTLLLYSAMISHSSCWIFQHLKSPTNEVHFSSKSEVEEKHLCIQLPFHFCTLQLLFYTPAFSAIITLNIPNSLFSPSSYSSLSLISLGKPACCLTSHPVLNS